MIAQWSVAYNFQFVLRSVHLDVSRQRIVPALYPDQRAGLFRASLRQELSGLGYVNTKLVGVTYYDKEEKKELISGIRTLDGRQNALPKVVKCAGNVMQAAHASILGSSEKTVFSVMWAASSDFP